MLGKVEICGVNTAKLPTLTAAETDALLRRAKNGDSAARERLVEGNLRLVLSGLKLWQLIDLALPMIVALAAEVLLMVVFSLLVVFPVMGRNYDAAMITAGFIGFGMEIGRAHV